VTKAPIKLAHTTLAHNADVIRRELVLWAKTCTPPLAYGEWRAAARHAAFHTAISDASLVIDSFDLPIERIGKTREGNSEYWSAKLGRPGWRYMLISDASGGVRFLS
jgi:hypothetical protein